MAPLNPAAIHDRLPQPGPGARYLIGYSGGLDSTVLLHLLATTARESQKLAVHIHHGLQPAAGEWATHCEQYCQQLAMPFMLLRVTPRRGARRSLEAEARDARYAALREVMHAGDVLLTAHHQDDQAETLLLQLLRGAGPRGLAAMPAVGAFPPGLHARPLLPYPRTALAEYARRQGLNWIEDPSNADTGHARNFLRQDIIPQLRQRWPELAATLGRSAAHCAEAAELLDTLAEDDLEWCAGPETGSLMIPALRQLAPVRRRNLLRVWMGWLGLPLPEAQHLQRLDAELLNAAGDAMPLLAWRGVELRRYRDRIFASPPLPVPDPDWHASWRLDERLELPAAAGWLEAEWTPAGPRLRPPQPGEDIRVRWARDGERLRLSSRGRHSVLKNLCQDSGIPPWVRRRLPVIEYGGHPAAVADRWVCAGFAAADGEPGWQLHWREPPAGYPSG